MEKRTKSIELLNMAVNEEIISTHQYIYFHFICEDRGYDPMAAFFKKKSIEEMMHISIFSQRILFLGGEVNMNVNLNVMHERDIEKMLELSMRLEEKSIIDYNKFAHTLSEIEDNGSKVIFDQIITVEEQHFDDFDIQKQNLLKFGDTYLALQAFDHTKK